MKYFMQGVDEKWRRRLAVAFFALLSLLPFLPFFLDSSRVLLFRDLSETDLPSKTFWLQSVWSEGRIPLWNHLQGGGAPYYADLVAGPLHPLNFLYLLFGFDRVPQALTASIITHYPFIFFGTFLLLRDLRTPLLGSLLFALVSAWNGYAVSAHSLTHVLLGVTALPWFALFWRRALLTRAWPPLFAASFFLALPIYGGDPQFTYVMALGALVGAFIELPARQVFLRWGALGVLSVLAAAAQLLPSLRLLLESDRALEVTAPIWSTVEWAAHPARFVEMLLPHFFGGPDQATEFWGAYQTGRTMTTFFLPSIYLGAFTAWLLAWSVVSGRVRAIFSSRAARVWLAFGGVIFLASLGGWLKPDVYSLLSKPLPFWGSFRYPERLLIYVIFGLTIWAAASFRELMKEGERTGKAPGRLWTTGALALLVIVLIAGVFSARYAQHGPLWKIAALEGLLQALSAGAAVVFAVTRRKSAALVLTLVVCFAFLRQFDGAIRFQSDSIARAEAYPVMQKIRADIDKRSEERRWGAPDRILSFDRYQSGWWRESRHLTRFSNMELIELVRWEGLAGNLPSYFGIPSVQGHHSIGTLGTEVLVEHLRYVDYSSLINLLGARYLIKRHQGVPPEVKVNLDAMPNFSVVDEVIPVGSLAEAIKLLGERRGERNQKRDQARDLARTGNLSGKVAVVVNPEPAPKLAASRQFSIELIARDSASIVYRLHSEKAADAAFLSLNSTYYSAWRAFVNGRPVPLKLVNGWAMGLTMRDIPAGTSEIRLEFRDPYIRIGQVLTGAWLLCFVGISFGAGWVRRRKFSV